MSSAPLRLICLSEDRPGAEAYLELALLSLQHHQPATRVVLHRPNPTAEVRAWTRRFPSLTLVETVPGDPIGWDCKPHVLIHHLEAGATEAVWLDSDLLLLNPLDHVIDGLSAATLAIAQEPRRANHGEYSAQARTRAWGLEPGRSIPTTLNSCFLRVTDRHLPLLREWRRLLADERYRRESTQPRSRRADYFYGDQDSLNALLAARDWSDVPLRILATGRDLIQSAGPLSFSLRDRWRCATSRGPLGVHAIDVKPWKLLAPGAEKRFSRLLRLYAETSTYAFAARRYRDEVEPPRSAWMRTSTSTGTLLKLASLGRLSLQGAPLTLAASIISALMPHRVWHEPTSD